jgi:hypothetical protein
LKISKTTLYRYAEIATGRVIRSRNHSRLRRHTGAAGPKTHTILRTLLGRQIAIRLGGIGPQGETADHTLGNRRRIRTIVGTGPFGLRLAGSGGVGRREWIRQLVCGYAQGS